MLLFNCLPELQIYPWGATRYLSSFPNGKNFLWALLSRKATKQMSGGENSPGWAAPAAPTAAPEVSQEACPGIGRKPLWKHPALVRIRRWKKAASSLGDDFPCFCCWWEAHPCCPQVSLGCLAQTLGDPSRSGHRAASTQPGHAAVSRPPKPSPEAGM